MDQKDEQVIRVPFQVPPPSPPVLPVMDQVRIAAELRRQHDGFMSRYSMLVEKNIQERNLTRVQTFARLKYVAEAFIQAGVISDFQVIDVLNYPSSVVMLPKVGDFPVYLVNDCGNVVVAIGAAVGQDPLSARMVLASASAARDGFFARAKDVLNPEFDWMKFSCLLLQEMHNTVYSSDQAIRDVFDTHLRKE